MRRFDLMLSLLASLVLAGCASAPAPAPAQASPAAPAPAIPAPAAKPAPAPVTNPEPPAVAPAAPTPPAKGSKPINENRVYQLNELERATIRINGKPIRVWIMDTESKMQEGMMHLNTGDVEDDEGMIFVYAQPQPMAFWMLNTRIPLDIAYVDASKRILNIASMKPFDETTTPSRGAALYAIEVKKGIMAKIGARPGMKVEIPDTVKNRDQ